MYNKSIILIFCLFTVFGYSQNSTFKVSGYITDKSTKDPLEFVNILCSETKTGSVTDSLGFFVITEDQKQYQLKRLMMTLIKTFQTF